LSARALQEAFDHLPSSWIKTLSEHLKKTNKKLYVKAGVRRGHFLERPDGNYEIHLSSTRGKRSDQTKVTDTALHELTHFLQRTVPNFRQMEHAYTYDRAVQNPGTPEESLPNIKRIGNGEFSLAVPGMANDYTFKQYNRADSRAFLNPNDSASEVGTTIMQDLFTFPGIVSNPNGMVAVSKDAQGNKNVHAFVEYKGDKWIDRMTGKEITDPVIASFGRDTKAGIDRDIKSFGMGLILMLNDWSPTKGFGPGNAVETPESK
jgi:hypothetical protein